jgi:hypothetical protein
MKNLKLKNLQDEIRFGEEIQEQHGKRNQTSLRHSYHHIWNLPKKNCKKKIASRNLVKYILVHVAIEVCGDSAQPLLCRGQTF